MRDRGVKTGVHHIAFEIFFIFYFLFLLFLTQLCHVGWLLLLAEAQNVLATRAGFFFVPFTFRLAKGPVVLPLTLNVQSEFEVNC